ncbi:MAG: flagellar hook protein FlgE [Armatimonadia bacterium]
MNRTLLAGLSGTLANQTYIDVLGNNVANANTIGFRESRVTFQDAFYQTLSGGRTGGDLGLGGMDPAQVGSGTTIGQIQTVHTQGAMRYSGSPLDAAIEGNGMFVLDNGSGGYLYTRDGAFILDNNRTLVAGSSGQCVMGWMAQNGTVNPTGEPTALTFPLGQVRPGSMTGNVELGGNLDAGLAAGDTRTATVSVYDSLGLSHQVTLTFTRGADANEWTCQGACEGTTASVDMAFDGTDGSLSSGGTLNLSVALGNGADTPLALGIDLSEVTQLNQEGSAVVVRSQDGSASATLSGVSILEGGGIQGEYSDGHVEVLGQIAVAGFANVGGLVRLGNNLYQEGANSGQTEIGAAGTSGRGEIRSRRLEMSNVDLTRSFVEIMTAQRGFQASTRVISAANRMLDDVMQLNIG